MSGISKVALGLVLAVAGCAPPLPEGPKPADLAAELRETPAPADVHGTCWTKDTLPALPEPAPKAKPKAPEDDSAEAAPAIAQPGRMVWFRTLCSEALTPAFTESLQRALKARGLYGGPVTGTLDAATRDALRRYQAPLGLDSGEISLKGAQSLGLIPVPLT